MKNNKIKSLRGEFKAFISRGNVIDMAIGVIIGSAFSAIINTLVNNIFMPLITFAVPQGLDGLVTVLNKDAALATSDTVNTVSYWGVTYDADIVNVINWGAFVNAIINFIIIALILFIILKIFTSLKNRRNAIIEKMKKKEETKVETPKEEPKPSEEVLLLREIRDSLKQKETK